MSTRQGRFTASPVVTALALLVLTGHAVLTGATHSHRTGGTGGAGATPYVAGTLIMRGEGTRESPPANGHSHCLLCSLQRDFALGLQHTAPAIVAPGLETRDPDTLRPSQFSNAHFSPVMGRAPPFA